MSAVLAIWLIVIFLVWRIWLGFFKREELNSQPAPENFDGFDYEYSCLKSMAMKPPQAKRPPMKETSHP